jgi:methionyl aminopeptidase
MDFVVLKDNNWLVKQKHAGQCVASILKNCGEAIKPNLSIIELGEIALEIFKEYNCVATFLNYNGFPSSICVSVNKVLVHGIVSDYILQSGDVVSVDVGATFEGAIADAARTWICGEPKSNIHIEMLEVCKKALLAGQEAVKVGNRIGAIGNAISKVVSKSPFGLITEYGGHGVSGPNGELHTNPFIANKACSNEGVRITNGLSIAIEPMVVVGRPTTKVGPDGWAVYTPDIGCHFENSITLLNDTIHIITGEIL